MKRIIHDNIHFDGRRLDSYGKSFNIIITERETGKSTWAYTKMYKAYFHKHRPSILIRRMIVDITDVWIESVADTINQFLPDEKKIKLFYKKGAIKDGVVNVYIQGRPDVFFMVIALSNPKSRIKSLVLEDPMYIIFDEFVLDTTTGEKWLSNEAQRFQDLYATFARHATKYGQKLRCYFLGNPYTVYSPYMVWLDIRLSDVKPGCFLIGKDYIVDCQQLKPELKQWLLKNNPLYQFDNSFTRYLFGEAINDSRFLIQEKQPVGYTLKYIYRVNHRLLGIYWCPSGKKDHYNVDYGKFWISILPDYKGSKTVIACNFDDLVIGNKTTLASPQMKSATFYLRQAIGNMNVTYQSIECGYLIEGIYTLI